jgi:hypothetical protein
MVEQDLVDLAGCLLDGVQELTLGFLKQMNVDDHALDLAVEYLLDHFWILSG